MHHYNPLYSGLASILTLVAAFANLRMMSDDDSRRETGWRRNMRARRRAHPKLMTLSWTCLTGAFVLLLTALVTWLA